MFSSLLYLVLDAMVLPCPCSSCPGFLVGRGLSRSDGVSSLAVTICTGLAVGVIVTDEFIFVSVGFFVIKDISI